MLKKLKTYIVVGIVAGLMYTGIRTVKAVSDNRTYKAESRDINLDRPLEKLIVTGDGGEQSAQAKHYIELIKKFKAGDIYVNGDNAYPTITNVKKDFAKYVLPLKQEGTDVFLDTGNHDFYAGDKLKEFMAYVESQYGFRMPDYTYGVFYKNACSLFIPSSIWEEKMKHDEDYETIKSQSLAYIDHFFNKCPLGNTVIVNAHHCIKSESGSHGGYKTEEYKKLYDRYLSKANFFFCGHNHVVEDNGMIGNTHHITSGALAKKDSCKTESCREGGFVYLNILTGQGSIVNDEERK